MHEPQLESCTRKPGLSSEHGELGGIRAGSRHKGPVENGLPVF